MSVKHGSSAAMTAKNWSSIRATFWAWVWKASADGGRSWIYGMWITHRHEQRYVARDVVMFRSR